MGGPPPCLCEPLVVPAGAVRLTGLRCGAGGRPPAVFLHAGVCDHRSWQAVLDLLGTDMDVVAYDRRGFGSTVGPAEPHDQVADLCAVLDATGMERAVLVGNSRGGAIALGAALAHPGRVAALVLVAPAVTGVPPTPAAEIDEATAVIWTGLEAAEAAGDLEALNRGEIRLWLDGPGAPEGRVGGAARELALQMNRTALTAPTPGPEAELPAAWPRLAEVSCPTLVVAGDLDLPHMQARARVVAERIPGARLEVMAGTAHLPALEAPAAFAEVVRRFLSGIGFSDR